MARPRYYNVLRGYRGPAARTKFLNYLEGVAQPDKVGQGTNRPASVLLYVKMFGLSLGDTVLVTASALQPAYNALQAAVNTGGKRIDNVIPASNTAVKLRNIKAARVSAVSGLLTTGTYKTSTKTGLPYLDYGGTAYSCPFGRATVNEKEGEAFEAIRGALGANFKRIHLIEETL